MFSKKNIKDIPIEQTPHATGSRKLLVGHSDTSSKYFEAYTYGFLPPHKIWEMHQHENIVEICLVIKGAGVIRTPKGEVENFELGDRFIFPSNSEHEIENTSNETAEFYFIRVKEN